MIDKYSINIKPLLKDVQKLRIVKVQTCINRVLKTLHPKYSIDLSNLNTLRKVKVQMINIDFKGCSEKLGDLYSIGLSGQLISKNVNNKSETMKRNTAINNLQGITILSNNAHALAKSSVGFRTPKNRGDISTSIRTCFFYVSNSLLRLLESSRIIMVGCVEVVAFVLRSNSMQPTTQSFEPLSGSYSNQTKESSND